VVEELTFGRIGEVIGLTEDGARKAFDRALQRLKENFQKS
jgi:DNA-directed RNA polymerase specialized sigma24 family protein